MKKLSAKKVFSISIGHILIGILLLVSVSCSWRVIYPSELTATALANVEENTQIYTETSLPSTFENQSNGKNNLDYALLSSTPTASESPSPTTIPPTLSPTIAPTTVTPDFTQNPPILYYTQSGDTVPALAIRFNVNPEQINSSDQEIPKTALLEPNLLLIIPDTLEETSNSTRLLPDSEVVFSPSAIDFSVASYVSDAGGYLNQYKEYLSSGWYTGVEVIERVAIENSVNPRLLLALVEYQSGWVTGDPSNLADTDYPLGWKQYKTKGLYRQLCWAVEKLSVGYYGWRAGLLTELTFPDDNTLRLAPDLNAGTTSVQNLFSYLYNLDDWNTALYSDDSFLSLYEDMFDNPWLRSQSVEPLYPPYLMQPDMELPFEAGHTWSMTGGPHSAWGKEGALAALDFAPESMEHGCVESYEWVTASVAGLVARTDTGVVILDLDGDGHEQTGWNILYLHVATDSRVKQGEWVEVDDKIGHPSCEGGVSTGTHVHIARKYNGEWILADGPLPFNLDGWTAAAGAEPYKGFLLNDNGDIVTASTSGSHESLVTRPE